MKSLLDIALKKEAQPKEAPPVKKSKIPFRKPKPQQQTVSPAPPPVDAEKQEDRRQLAAVLSAIMGGSNAPSEEDQEVALALANKLFDKKHLKMITETPNVSAMDALDAMEALIFAEYGEHSVLAKIIPIHDERMIGKDRKRSQEVVDIARGHKQEEEAALSNFQKLTSQME